MPHYALLECGGSPSRYYRISDAFPLYKYAGKILKGIDIQDIPVDPDTCWEVIVYHIPGHPYTLLGFDTIFSDCDICLETCVIPEPIPHSIDPLIKDFTQDPDTQCEIDIKKTFSSGYYSLFKTVYYGVTDCCTTFDLDQLWLSNELSDLSKLLVPDFICRKTPSPRCSWMPIQGCDLLTDPNGGISIVGIAGQDIPYGKLVELSQDGKLYKNDNTDLSTYQRVVGFTAVTTHIGRGTSVLTSGRFSKPNWGLTTGAIYYATTDGDITSTVPSASGTISQIIGIADNSSTLIVNISLPIVI